MQLKPSTTAGNKSFHAGVAAYSMAALQGYFNNTDYFKGEFMGGKFGPVSDFNRTTNFVLTNFSADVDGYKTALDNWPTFRHISVFSRLRNEYHRCGKAPCPGRSAFRANDHAYAWPQRHFVCGGRLAMRRAYEHRLRRASVVTNNPSYFDAFPDINMRYKITDDQGLRIVYGRASPVRSLPVDSLHHV